MDDHQNKSMALRALLTKLEKSVIIKTKYACMEPIIEENSLVRVTPISKPLKRGDILLIDQGYRFVTHRLLKIGRNGEYYTSGDNGCFFDTCDCQYTVLGLITSVKTENKWFEVNKPALLQYWLAVIGYAYIKRSSAQNRRTKKKHSFGTFLWQARKALARSSLKIYTKFADADQNRKNN